MLGLYGDYYWGYIGVILGFYWGSIGQAACFGSCSHGRIAFQVVLTDRRGMEVPPLRERLEVPESFLNSCTAIQGRTGRLKYLRWTPHPVIVTIEDNRIMLGSSYILIIPLLQGRGSS